MRISVVRNLDPSIRDRPDFFPCVQGPDTSGDGECGGSFPGGYPHAQ